jgi:predicted HicB family RNase H-like nuclease
MSNGSNSRTRRRMVISGFGADVTFDPRDGLYRGKFSDTSVALKFSGRDDVALRQVAASVLEAFLERCERMGTPARRQAKPD